jgi:iron complex transport system ATP-binding protein
MQPALRMEGVSWRRDGTAILSDISWTVWPGEHWALIGVNGSGKTSLLHLVTGYEWASTGKIEVLGQRFGQCDLRELRKSIGWVSIALQERFAVSHPNERAVDVVISGRFASIGIYDDPTPDDMDRALRLLTQFGLSHRAEYPFGRLSQGERQRALLARAFMGSPRLLILDEPCTGLDLPAREQFLQSLTQAVRTDDAPTLLYVTHHPEEVLPLFTHVLLLADGRIVAAGPKRDVLTSEHLSAAFGLSVQVEWQNDRPWVRVRG